MLYFLPIMLFLYAQNSTDYALNYALKLPIMLKLCSLFLEGANSNNRITLLCTTSQFHHQSRTSRSYHVKTLSLGAEPRHEDEILGTQLVTRQSEGKITSRSQTLCSKITYYSRIMLNAY